MKWVPGEFPGTKCGRCLRLTLPPPCAIVMKTGNLNFLEPSGPLKACNGTALPLPSNILTTLTSLVLHYSLCPSVVHHAQQLPTSNVWANVSDLETNSTVWNLSIFSRKNIMIISVILLLGFQLQWCQIALWVTKILRYHTFAVTLGQTDARHQKVQGKKSQL